MCFVFGYKAKQFQKSNKELENKKKRNLGSISSTFFTGIFRKKVCSKPSSKQRKAAQFPFLKKLHA